jgi:hypothetical protein
MVAPLQWDRPKTLDSSDSARLSPMTKKCTCGTFVEPKLLCSGASGLGYGSFWGTPFKKSSLSRSAIFTSGSPRTRFTRTASSWSALALNTVIFPHGLDKAVDELVGQHPLAHLGRRDHARGGYIEHPNDERPHVPRRRGGRSLRATREQTRGGPRSPFRRLCACDASWARHLREDVSRVHFFI